MTLMCIMGGLNLSHLFAQAQETITIGDGTSTSYYAPLAEYGYVSLSQVLYLKEDINRDPGMITSISFKMKTGYARNRNVVVYMTNVDKDSYTSQTDWVQVSNADIVFEGEYALKTSNNWATIELANPFVYTGGDIAITVNDKTGVRYSSGYSSFNATASPNAVKRGLYVYNNSSTTPYDCSNLSVISGYYTTAYINGVSGTPMFPNVSFTYEVLDDLEPATPTDLVAADKDAQSISLTWSDAENAQKYNIYQNGVNIGNSNSTSYDVTGLTPNTTYNFTVTGVRGTKESAQSAPVEATTENVGAPSNLVAETIDHKSISLTWTGGDNATSYNIYKNGSYLANTTTTSYTVEGLDSETTYTFTVKSVCARNEYGSSNEASATTAGIEPGTYEIEIGKGATGGVTDYQGVGYLPSNTYYNYSYSQQIYTADEISFVPGNITKIAFKLKTSGLNSKSRKLRVYVVNTDKESFSGGSDWVSVTDGDLYYDNTVNLPGANGWLELNFTKPFNYDGGNVLITVQDYTGNEYFMSEFYSYNTSNRAISIYNDNTSYGPTNPGSGALRNHNNQIKFSIEVTRPSVTLEPEGPIALGNIRMDDEFFTEKAFAPKNVEVKVTSTKVTSVTCDNSFFTINGVPDALDKTFTFNVGYNKEANVTEPQNGTITIKWQDGDDVTIPVSATPYTATAPDAIEAFTEVEFTDNAYTNTPTFGNLHDDYILPGETEETDGNAPDAVYKFTLADEAVLSASITGNDIENSYLAIYNAETMGNGPSSDNNDTGVQAGPQGPTTFGPYTFTTDGTDLTNNFNSSGWNHYVQGGGYIYTQTEGSYIMTKDAFSITNTSVLTFEAKNVWGGTEHYNVFISADEVYGNADDIIVEELSVSLNPTSEEIDFGENSGIYHIGISYLYTTNNGGMFGIDNLALTDGSSKSRGLAPAIDAVQYPAGTYYLVAAADKAFTVNISTATVPAPEKAELTAPENNATEQDNPVLKWNAAQYATEYQVLLGTTNPPTEVVKDWTENIFSYQTEGLTNNTRYYWQVKAKNAKGESTSDVYSFVTTLDIPQITSEKEVEVFTDSEAPVITWNAIAGAKYNVYKDGVKLNALITETSYTLSDLTYNMTGSAYTVKAVYENLNMESSASETVNVKVSGYGDLTVTVKDGENAIKLASVVITGTDEFGNAVNYGGATDENGVFAVVKVKVGSYTASASKFNYEDNDASVTVGHNAVAQTTITLQSVSLEADADVLSGVAAAEDGDDAKVTWRGANNNTQMYNVYRKNVDTDEVTSLVTNYNVSYNRTDEYTDAAYSELADGKYQYAVTTMVGVPEEVEIMKEGFDNGTLPTGWTYDNCWYPYSYDGNPPGCAYFYSNSSYVTGRLYTTIIDLTQNTTSKLTFDYKNVIGHQHANNFYVDVYSENGNQLKSQTVTGNAVASYTSYELSLNDYVGQKIRLCFRGYNYGWGYTYIDNVVVSGTRIKTVESSAVWSNEIKKGGIRFTNAAGDNKWETAGNWNTGVVPEDGSEVTIMAVATLSTHRTVSYLAIGGGSLTLNAGANLTVTGDLISDDVLGLYINDGAQLFHKSENVMATFNMDILNPTEWSDSNKDGWQFISSPFVTASVSDFTNSNTYVYDLYKYNGTADLEWDNYKDNNAAFGYEFVQGTGYLASYSTLGTATLKGELNATSSYTWEGLHNENGKDLANFHLLGNPFAFDMDWSKVSSEGLVEGYAVIDAENGSAYEYKTNGTIKLGDGFFVKTSADNASLSYTHSARGLRGERANSLNIIATSNAGKDNVIINLAGESDGFDKLQNFNDAVATVYVQNEGKNYGIYNCDENVQEVELQFNANKMGSYTISIEPDGKFESVTLVDRFTGTETNMLLEDYSFTAMSTDNNNRFIVKLKASGQKVEENDNFVYQNGEDLIVNGEGTVQIIDVMGRILYSNDVESTNGRIDVSNLNRATYIVRCINGNEVKSQKIVVL